MFRKIRWYHVLSVVIFLLIFGQGLIYDLLFSPELPDIPKSTLETKSEKNDFVRSGDVAYLSQDVLAALTKEGAEELQNYLIAKNYEAAERMIIRGDVFAVDGGTEVTVIERGFIYAHIEVHGTGLRGYVPGEFLRK